MPLKTNRVTQALVSRHSFEAGVMDMFKNMFSSKASKTAWDGKVRSDKFGKLLDKTFLKPKWVEDNCKEMIELDIHEFPFLSMYEPKDEFITSKELIDGVTKFNSKIEEAYSPLDKAMDWASKIFDEAVKEVKKVGPKDRSFTEGLMDEDELGDDVGVVNEAIEKVMDKHRSEREKYEKNLKPTKVEFSPYLETADGDFKLKGKSTKIKITIEELVDFLKLMKKEEILEDDIAMISSFTPLNYDSPSPVYITSFGYSDFHEFLFLDLFHENEFIYGDPTKFYSLETLIDVLKEFIDK